MRWKLMVIASLLATLVGAGANLTIAYLVFGPTWRATMPAIAAAAGLVLPLAATIFASIFVYRHTARRRTLQAWATALLSLLLTLAVIAAGAFILTGRLPVTIPTPEPPSHGM